MMNAFIKRRKIPKVTIVMGKVRITKIGFTISLRRAITMATTTAEPYPATFTPGKISAKTITAIAVKRSLSISTMQFSLAPGPYQ